MSKKLMPNAQAPEIRLPLVDGTEFDLSTNSPKNFTMIVFYRGLHCPKCQAHLQKLTQLKDAYAKAGVKVVAVSMDTQERAQKAVKEWQLGDLPVAYGLTAEQARDWGLWLSTARHDGEAKVYSEPGLFCIHPDGRIYLMDISNSPFIRPDLDTVLPALEFISKENYPVRGTYTI